MMARIISTVSFQKAQTLHQCVQVLHVSLPFYKSFGFALATYKKIFGDHIGEVAMHLLCTTVLILANSLNSL